uniref:Protein kinase domain-containing protein n=1 Tax=Ananas comosus var. bracteatus TaxID=296719 RepID=A0A6V7NEN7_ANACO|nr:unnamed protein product [Ananas comosus var. bracteatus]
MRGLSHQNVLRLLEVMATRSEIYLVTCRKEAEARATARGAGGRRHAAGVGAGAGAGVGSSAGAAGRGRAPARGPPRGGAGSAARRGVCKEAEARVTARGTGDGEGRGRPRVRRGHGAGSARAAGWWVARGPQGQSGPVDHILSSPRCATVTLAVWRTADIKPQNLLLAHDDALKLSDFGLAALTEQRGHDGHLCTACGTLAYAVLFINGSETFS